MTPQELKNSILQRAIQGKLVEQRSEEGTAEELYQQIQAEKQALIKAGKIKKEKPLPEIAEEEKPFDIPESWKWVRLRDICTKIVDGDRNPPAGITTKTEFLMLSATNINHDTLCELDKVRYLAKETFDIEHERTRATIGDIFFTTVGTLGRSCVFDGNYNVCFQRSVSVITTLICNFFLKYCLDSGYIQNYMVVNATGTAQKGFYLNQVEKLLIPLPPLAEQERIVAKIEELLPLIDRYETAYTRLEEFNKRFPGDMQKSLLQMAIQGKLVEQRPEEGTGEELFQQIQAEKQALIKAGKIKKDKSLPAITDDEKPFDIPESWKWVRLGEILTSTDAGKSPQCEDRPHLSNEWGVIKTTAIQNGIFLPKENKVLPEKFIVQDSQIIHYGDLLITRAGPRNRTGVLCVVSEEPTNLILSDKTVRLSYIKGLVDPLFIMYMLNSPAGQVSIIEAMTGMAASQVNISQDSMKKFRLPLPPLAEQKRIVAKLEELLPLCERLK